jgi:hypothetical protein
VPVPLRMAAPDADRQRRLALFLAASADDRSRAERAVHLAFAVATGVSAAALDAVRREGRLEPQALLRWHASIGGSGIFRERDVVAPAAPPAFIESRLGSLAEWLETESGRELKAAEAGALVLARILEIQPFDQGNEPVAHLACRHAMRRGGGPGPLLLAEDLSRLREAAAAAQAFDTAPLVALLAEAEGRALERAAAELEG